MATTLEQKIDQLLGRLDMSGGGGGVMNLLDTPANQVQEAHRERYLMDMFAGTNPDTGESFLEPAETEYEKKLKELRGFAKESGMSNDELTQRQLAILGAGKYGVDMPNSNPYSDKTSMLKMLADQMGMTVQEYLATGSGARGLATPAMRDAFVEQDAYLKSLNVGSRGLDTPAEQNAIMNSITTNNLGLSASELGFSNPRGFPTPATRENAQAVLSRLSEAEYRDVMEILPQLNDEQYQAFIAGLENGSINPSGYEIQNQDRLRMY